MTPPIPLGAERKRPSKSCLPCRQAKAKCVGLSEEYLHAVDQEDYIPDPNIPRPRCSRCTKMGADCNFAASRRKGRPRRVTKEEELQMQLQQQQRNQQATPSVSPRSSPSASPSRSGSDSFNPLRTTGDFAGNYSPSQATSLSGSLHQPSPCWSLPTPESSATPLPEFSIEEIAEGYLAEIYIWAPLLPPDSKNLQEYLHRADPSLAQALACTLDTSRSPPAFPPQGAISFATLQAAVFLSLRAYGIKDRTNAVDLIIWVSNELRGLGWNGHDMSSIASEIRGSEIEAFIGLGYLVWGLTIQLGVLTGNRGLLLAVIQLPSEISPQNMVLHSFALLRDSTDFDTLWALKDDQQRFNYTVEIIQRSDRIQKAALEYLRTTTPAFDPSSAATPSSLTLAAARESAFLASSIAPASVILLLSSTSPLSPLIAPTLPCSLDTTSYPTGPLACLVRVAATKILDVVRTSPTKEGLSVAAQNHSPYWGCCFLVTSRGLLLGAEAAQVQGDEALLSYDHQQLESDLDLCEAILRQQATKWPAAESLMTEVGLLRRTAGIL
ncbi:hypothetical protein JCM5353_007905 [Sporobolomyces roseus]